MGEQEKMVHHAQCFCTKNQEWMERMDAKMDRNIWKGSGLVSYLWCFNCAAFHFVTLPNQHPSATSVPTPCHSVRSWNPLSTNAWPVWEQLGDSEKCCDGFSSKLKGRCQMLMQYCCIDIVYPMLKHCCMIWHAVVFDCTETRVHSLTRSYFLVALFFWWLSDNSNLDSQTCSFGERVHLRYLLTPATPACIALLSACLGLRHFL